MANQNQCNFTGRIGHIETRYTPDNFPITHLSLAVSKSKKDKTGNRINQTTWVRCVLFGEKADYANKVIQKGYFVRISANFQEQKWTDKTGNERASSQFLVNEIEILDNRKEKKQQESQARPNVPTTNQPDSNTIIEPDFDDSIPF
ncbi:single-stranded DNA-binding protein [Candidatus Arsenophonus triatominarum]|uniref:single-stranded DNA-binding protein n=1 Tax=Candidatus Arsenophonus triatominarum TaxID=57911 RepID=UPI000940A564|nr:single-stranded DNA-binding protein [Candidatus Arsenophonus triatominarum]